MMGSFERYLLGQSMKLFEGSHMDSSRESSKPARADQVEFQPLCNRLKGTGPARFSRLNAGSRAEEEGMFLGLSPFHLLQVVRRSAVLPCSVQEQVCVR